MLPPPHAANEFLGLKRLLSKWTSFHSIRGGSYYLLSLNSKIELVTASAVMPPTSPNPYLQETAAYSWEKLFCSWLSFRWALPRAMELPWARRMEFKSYLITTMFIMRPTIHLKFSILERNIYISYKSTKCLQSFHQISQVSLSSIREDPGMVEKGFSWRPLLLFLLQAISYVVYHRLKKSHISGEKVPGRSSGGWSLIIFWLTLK